jgi:heme exporter protein CcmD
MNHDFFIWMSYGATAAAVLVEVAGLLLRRSRALTRIEEERDLETQD